MGNRRYIFTWIMGVQPIQFGLYQGNGGILPPPYHGNKPHSYDLHLKIMCPISPLTMDIQGESKQIIHS